MRINDEEKKRIERARRYEAQRRGINVTRDEREMANAREYVKNVNREKRETAIANGEMTHEIRETYNAVNGSKTNKKYAVARSQWDREHDEVRPHKEVRHYHKAYRETFILYDKGYGKIMTEEINETVEITYNGYGGRRVEIMKSMTKYGMDIKLVEIYDIPENKIIMNGEGYDTRNVVEVANKKRVKIYEAHME